MTSAPRTVLVSMPWPYLQMPSLQLGTVTAILQRAGYPVRPVSAYLLFMEYLAACNAGLPEAEHFTMEHYEHMSERSWQNGLGDWVFATAPFAEPTPERDAAYLQWVGRRESPAMLEVAKRMRERADRYLDRMVEVVLEDDPDVVGFTTTFNQNVPSLNLAARLKAAKPNVVILFGGANCDGPMGTGLHEAYQQIDYVVRGEAEYALPAAMECIAGHRDRASVPGLVYRHEGSTITNPATAASAVAMRDVPLPQYDEYFERLRSSPLRAALEASVALPVESSRGCWWGEKHHCTFCGLNGSSIAFRGKDPDVVRRRGVHALEALPPHQVPDRRQHPGPALLQDLVPWLIRTAASRQRLRRSSTRSRPTSRKEQLAHDEGGRHLLDPARHREHELARAQADGQGRHRAAEHPRC